MRDALIIFAVCLIAVGAGAWLFLAGGTDAPHSAAGVSFAVIDRGTESGEIEQRVNYHIKSAEELSELWEAIHGENGGPPAVDFSKHHVLAIFDGTHATGGYDVRVVSVNDVNGLHREVAIVHVEPGATCSVTEAFTSPYELIVVPKSDAELTREDTVMVQDCG